jgi:hypothetical protein
MQFEPCGSEWKLAPWPTPGSDPNDPPREKHHEA